MATGDTHAYSKYLENTDNGAAPVDWDSDTMKVALLKSTYTPNYSGDEFFASISSLQVTAGTAYVAGGKNLASLSVTISGSFVCLKTGTISFAVDAAGFSTARYAVVYDYIGASTATSPVVAVMDLGSDRANTAGPLLIYWTGDKVLKKQI